MKDAVIFDLDQTLVDSRHLAPYRSAGDWATVMTNVHAVRVYPGIGEMLQEVRRLGYRIAIVSVSPRDYCEAICVANNLPMDVLVGYHDVNHPKPARDGHILAGGQLFNVAGHNGKDEIAHIAQELRAQKLHFRTVGVGDSWKDTLAARAAGMDSIACLWGADDPRELILSEPTFIARSPSELTEHLAALRVTQYRLRDLEKRSTDAYLEGLWRQAAHTGGRHHLRIGQAYTFVHERHRGNWSTSLANSLIANLKLPANEQARRWLKEKAAERFAKDLAQLLPQKAAMMFIPGSKVRGDPAFDDRFDITWNLLRMQRPDVSLISCIEAHRSREAVHEQDDFNARSPEQILEHWRWNGSALTPGHLYVVDDVLTSGGHFEATIRMIESTSSGVAVTGAFWAQSVG